MEVLFWTVALIVASGALGLGVYSLLKKSKHPWLRRFLSTVPGLLVLIISVIAFSKGGNKPASNEPVGYQRKLSINFEHALRPGEAPDDYFHAPFETVDVFFPSSVTPQQDFTLVLAVQHIEPSIAKKVRMYPEKHAVQLSASTSVKLRTSDECAGPEHKNDPTFACASLDKAGFRVAWDITPTEVGSPKFIFTIPSSLIVLPDSGWRVYLNESGDVGWDAYVGETRGLPRGAISFISPERPFAQWRGTTIDITKRQIRVPVEVVTTLGVTRKSYILISATASAVSAFLGSGWLWQLLTLIRSRRDEAKSQSA